jgi:arylsulfatase A-like enzyme
VPVTTVDFFPTFLEATNSKAASGATLDGVSLLPVLKGTAGLPRNELYWHYPHYSNQGGKPGSAVRQREYKLIEFYEDGQLELYNLQTDSGEKNNLARQQPEITRQLKAKLNAWRQEVNAQLPKPNPEYNSQAKD